MQFMAVIDWNCRDILEALRHPAGRYVVEPLDQQPSLSIDGEDRLIQALASLQAGRGSREQVRSRPLNRASPPSAPSRVLSNLQG
jgi:hypothetical protein